LSAAMPQVQDLLPALPEFRTHFCARKLSKSLGHSAMSSAQIFLF
jgi:hypothetical protein